MYFCELLRFGGTTRISTDLACSYTMRMKKKKNGSQ
jgi:hypothetical protein